MGRGAEDRPGDDRAVSGAARSETSLAATTDMPMALGDCIAELGEHLGIEVPR